MLNHKFIIQQLKWLPPVDLQLEFTVSHLSVFDPHCLDQRKWECIPSCRVSTHSGRPSLVPCVFYYQQAKTERLSHPAHSTAAVCVCVRLKHSSHINTSASINLLAVEWLCCRPALGCLPLCVSLCLSFPHQCSWHIPGLHLPLYLQHCWLHSPNSWKIWTCADLQDLY